MLVYPIVQAVYITTRFSWKFRNIICLYILKKAKRIKKNKKQQYQCKMCYSLHINFKLSQANQVILNNWKHVCNICGAIVSTTVTQPAVLGSVDGLAEGQVFLIGPVSGSAWKVFSSELNLLLDTVLCRSFAIKKPPLYEKATLWVPWWKSIR